MGTSSKELARKLQKRVERQHGCFTAAQAVEVGYADSVHLYHVRTGSWVRVYRGVYRLASHPETPESRCMAALLWTRDKTGKIQGRLAQEIVRELQAGTLDLHQPIRIAVDPGFRRSSTVPKGILLDVFDPKIHKSSKMNFLPVVEIHEKHKSGALPVPGQLDAPDYYDWIDYQAVLCDLKS